MRHYLSLEDHRSVLAAIILTVWVVVPVLIWAVVILVSLKVL